MMARTQITLDPETHRLARERAHALGISLAEYVRRVLAEDLRPQKPAADVTRIFDLGNSGGSNIARDKRAMVGEAIEQQMKKWR